MPVSIRRVAAAAALSLALAACGGDAEAPAPASPPESSAAPTVATGDSIKVGRAPNTAFTVTAEDLGIHSFTTQPGVATKSIRLTCFPNWATVNTGPGEFDWTDFDAAIARVESWGMTDLMYSFCATPKWAGTPVSGNDRAAFGPGTAQPPKDMDLWQEWVTAVAKRYKGRITGYEIWNEPSSPQFFAGTPAQMAEMTEIAYEAINEVDQDAYVLSASAQTHNPDYYKDFFPAYLQGIKKAGWPVDGMALHFYPSGGGTPNDRVAQIEMVHKELDAAGAPADLPLWDTEVNYEVGLAGGEPKGRITGQRAAAWTAITYLDSWRTGVRRPYWYLWSADYYSFPGIQMREGDPATAALNLLALWTVGTEFTGCEEDGAAVICSFTGADGDFEIAYSTGGNATVPIEGTTQVCPIYGGECEQRSGSVTVNQTPVRIGDLPSPTPSG
jgi:hypothetical protein